MAKITPSMAKNQMRKSLNAILDPPPSPREVVHLWSFFDSSCAYCGVKLTLPERNGHLDHIVPHSAGGTNDVHNHALACARCNGDEKREEAWDAFLERKVSSQTLREERKARIKDWMEQAPPDRLRLSDQESQAVEEIVKRALQSFDAAVAELRVIRVKRNNTP